ncbi:SRPBCC family protein [Streptomyces sp. NPDC048639]|uniref:SRPBCC family protein n=1 Tax=Streptomyces sp. NPDC048639 TaxID=3365581 RepID=UPI003717ECE2
MADSRDSDSRDGRAGERDGEDRIVREIRIDAPVDRVWAVLTEPEHIGQWFGQGKPTPIDLRPGGIMHLDHGRYGYFLTRIVTVEPPRSFAYRWASGFPGEEATEENSTLVEFTLTEDGDGTLLRLEESGFLGRAVPAEPSPDDTYESHGAGWTGILDLVRAHVEALGAE